MQAQNVLPVLLRVREGAHVLLCDCCENMPWARVHLEEVLEFPLDPKKRHPQRLRRCLYTRMSVPFPYHLHLRLPFMYLRFLQIQRFEPNPLVDTAAMTGGRSRSAVRVWLEQ